MTTNVAALPAFAEADERAFDRAVRRLPGFWTWDYTDHDNGWPAAIISPPWDQNDTAFYISKSPGSPHYLSCSLRRRPNAEEADGEYPDFNHMLRVIRAVVMGDPVNEIEAQAEAKPTREARSSARGRLTTPEPNELSSTDLQEIRDTISGWHDEGYCAVEEPFHGMVYMEWDTRSPAFIIERAGSVVILEDRISWGRRNVTGNFKTIAAALAVVKAVVSGCWTGGASEEAQTFLMSKLRDFQPGGTMTLARFDAQFSEGAQA